jgi:hypothetical protein
LATLKQNDRCTWPHWGRHMRVGPYTLPATQPQEAQP